MSRNAKQFAYGFLYVIVVGLILFWILAPKLTPAPSCFDNIRNQGETGVDCGGPCTPCYLKNAKPLSVQGTPQLFKAADLGKTFAAVNFLNSNPDLGLHSFFYSASFLDESGNPVGTVTGYSGILPGESKYVIVEYDASSDDIGKIASVAVQFPQGESWSQSSDFLVPNLSMASGPFLSTTTNAVQISGAIQNGSAFSVPSVDVVAFILDKYGNPVFTGHTVVDNMPSFSTSSFSVYLPASVFAGTNLTVAKAQVFLSPGE